MFYSLYETNCVTSRTSNVCGRQLRGTAVPEPGMRALEPGRRTPEPATAAPEPGTPVRQPRHKIALSRTVKGPELV
jgi:hypothetical protein